MVELVDLHKASILESLDEAEVSLVSSVIEYRRCPAETVLMEAGSSDRSLYIVYSGSVRIVPTTGSEAPIAEILPGQHLGEMSFIDGGVRSATAVTNEATELLVIDPRRFASLAEESPSLAFKMCWSILRLLCSRLRHTDYWLFELMSRRNAGPVAGPQA